MSQKRDSTALLSAAELDPSHVMEVGTRFWRSKTLLSAVELDLFALLGAESMSGEEVGARLALHPRAIDDFPDARVALGFLEREGEGTNGRYRNSAEAAGDDAHRRLERDLHDGAQQRLVSLGLQIRMFEASMPAKLGAFKQRQCRGAAEGEARERPTRDARGCEVAVWLSGIDTVPIPQSLTRGIGYSGCPNGADPRHAEERKTYSLSSARTTFPRRESGDRHRERFHRRRVMMGGVIAGPFVEIAPARGEPMALRSCSAYPEIATDWHAPRSEEMPDFSCKTLIVNDVNVGARHR